MPKPSFPLPEPLRGTEIPSFTNYSITVRLPEIARRMIADNELPPAALMGVEQLIADIAVGKIRPIDVPLAPDQSEWQQYIAPYVGWDWLHVPWFFAETYFYERILEATGYFHPGPWRAADPFIRQKRLGLETSRNATQTLAEHASQVPAGATWQPAVFLKLLSIDLWGNQADLSLWPVDKGGESGVSAFISKDDHVLADDSAALVDYLSTHQTNAGRADLLLDNVGFELIGDLFLVDYLLRAGTFESIHLHAKAQPTFVSDALVGDVRYTIAYLWEMPDPAVREVAARLEKAIAAGKLVLRDHPFWTSPLPAWEMPASLLSELSTSDLVVSKGDANYRRFLGDRHWDYTAPLSGIVDYLPAPLLLLRTMKSEIAAGLSAAKIETAARTDPEWQINGQWGMIEFYAGG